jgi:hypothetical protein
MEFTGQDLRAVLNRSMRSTGLAALIGSPIVWMAWGWQSLLLFLVGALISATGILEWRQLMSAILLRLETKGDETGGDAKRKVRPMWRVLFWFFLRLILAAGLLYVSLKVLDGKVFALVAGLALAILVLLIEALRLFRSWSA